MVHADISAKVLFNKGSGGFTLAKYFMTQYILQEQFIVIHTQQLCVLYCRGQTTNSFGAVITISDDFSNHRIVERADLLPSLNTVIHTDTGSLRIMP